MKFELLDRYMRRFEMERQYTFPPEMYVVFQLDGLGFNSLFKDNHLRETPLDENFKKHLIETACTIMDQPTLSICYGFLFSDKISLLLTKSVDNFGRKARKIGSHLAGQASGKLSLLLEQVVSFDSRIYQLPNEECVVDYFFWKAEEAERYALHDYCIWLLQKKEKHSHKQAAQILQKMDIKAKQKLLRQNDYTLETLPSWERSGVAIRWEPYEKEGLNPKTGNKVKVWRKRLKVEEGIPPERDTYREFLLKLL